MLEPRNPGLPDWAKTIIRIVAIVIGLGALGIAVIVAYPDLVPAPPPRRESPAEPSPVVVARSPSPIAATSPVRQPTASVIASPVARPIPPPEEIIQAYYQALANNEAELARDLLTLSAQARNDLEDVQIVAESIETITVTRLQEVSREPRRIVYQAILAVEPAPNRPGFWDDGPNERFVEVVETTDGWRINRVTSTPVTDAEESQSPG